MNNIYESEVFSHLPDYSMHPGGLRLTDRAARLAKLTKGMTVADIGCGAGATAAYLSEKFGIKMIGLEISEALIRIGLKQTPGLHYIRWDCNTLPFEPESLDAVLFECTLSIISYCGKTLDECTKALKKHGLLIISDLLAKRREPEKPAAIPTLPELEAMLNEAGFTVVTSEDHTPALITYAAELKGQFDKAFNTSRFFCRHFPGGFRLSDYDYHLIIAKKM